MKLKQLNIVELSQSDKSVSLKNLVIFLRLLKYHKKKYYAGHIRWLIMDKNKKHILCSDCGNIANGVAELKLFGVEFQIAMCKKHLSETYFKQHPGATHLDFPVIAKI